MATIPSPHAFIAGESANASKFQSLTDAANFLLDPPGVSAFLLSALSVANDTDATLPLDGELYDNDVMHNPSFANSRLTANTPGRYRVTAQVAFSNNGTGYRTVQIMRNGIVIAQTKVASASGVVSSLVQCHREIVMSVGDYLELQVRQTSGGTLALGTGGTSTFLDAMWAKQS